MKVRLLFITLILGAGAFLAFQDDFVEFFASSGSKIQTAVDSLRGSENIRNVDEGERVSAPGPLRSDDATPDVTLTIDGVLRETNTHRTAAGLPPLTVNAQLSAAASAKVRDMFDRQYFAHETPDGKGPGDFAKEAGYVYIAVGENLALGGFRDDVHLVQAWMDSPGHRANMLSTRFREIGIAVGNGSYEGRTVWFAVQHFGFPQSACPLPDPDQRKEIEANNASVRELETEAKQRKAALDRDDPQTQEAVDAHNQKVEEYNALVQRLNQLVEETKRMVSDYNTRVAAYSACANPAANSSP